MTCGQGSRRVLRAAVLIGLGLEQEERFCPEDSYFHGGLSEEEIGDAGEEKAA